MSFREDEDRTSCQCTTGGDILSLQDEQQTIGSIGRRPERDSRERRSSNQPHPPSVVGAEAMLLIY